MEPLLYHYQTEYIVAVVRKKLDRGQYNFPNDFQPNPIFILVSVCD
jgi:hypothetical protein